METTTIQTALTPTTAKPAAPESNFWGEDGFTFDDVLDAINPFKQLPIISDIYEHFAGESEQSTGSKMVGGALFGGVLGVFSAFAQTTVAQETGHSVSEHIKLAMTGEPTTTQTAIATRTTTTTQIQGVSMLMIQAETPVDYHQLRAAQLTDALEKYRAMTQDSNTEALLEELQTHISPTNTIIA